MLHRRSRTELARRASGGLRKRGHPVGGRVSSRDDRDLRRLWSRALPAAFVLSVVAHGLLLALGSLPSRTRRPLARRGGVFVVVALPPQVRVPPAPGAVRRPDPPLVRAVEPAPPAVDPERRLAPPAPVPLPPPPSLSWDGGFRSAVGRAEVPPLLRDDWRLARARARFYPEELRRAGIGGEVGLRLFVEPSGEVDRVSVSRPSGHPALDRAAVQIGERMRFMPALARDRTVGVWVDQDICFVVRRAGERADPTGCVRLRRR